MADDEVEVRMGCVILAFGWITFLILSTGIVVVALRVMGVM